MIGASGRFSLGTNYAPDWVSLAHGDLERDAWQMAALNLDTVRLHLDWRLVQPRAETIDASALEAVAAAIAVFARAGLRVVPVLLGVRYGAPSWAHGDLYGGALLDAQERYAASIGERFAGSAGAAIAAWDLADDVATFRAPRAGQVIAGEHASEPVAERAMAAWTKRLAAALRCSGSQPVTAGIASYDVTNDRNVRLGSLYDALDLASIGGSIFDLPYARTARDAEALPFLAMLAAGFSHRAVLVHDIGTPTCPPGKFSAYDRAPGVGGSGTLDIADDDPVFATYPCMTEDEQAAYARAAIDRLAADGRLGAYWSAWRDTPGVPRGLVRHDGSEKPVAAVFRECSGARMPVIAPDDVPSIAAPFYYRTLPSSTRTLYDAYLSFVAGRR